MNNGIKDILGLSEPCSCSGTKGKAAEGRRNPNGWRVFQTPPNGAKRPGVRLSSGALTGLNARPDCFLPAKVENIWTRKITCIRVCSPKLAYVRGLGKKAQPGEVASAHFTGRSGWFFDN